MRLIRSPPKRQRRPKLRRHRVSRPANRARSRPERKTSMIRRKTTSEHENHERWLVSYADFITLLFAFFVVMFASTQADRNKAKEVSDSVRQALEHGQFGSAISTVLGRGKHEAKKS